ncbi:MAG: DUF4837 family protein [Saprospiraceae bacterium]|nr:DUF4837 family protein [Bacteroidia bacterium]NNL90717.1 DUF4837 family protein [Saprospiraceae bacterium]
MTRSIIYSVCILFCFSCNNEMTQQFEPKSSALGKMNEIVVVADDDLWESAIGDTFRYYFQSAYPILPTPEPIFDIRQFSIKELNNQPLRKELRTYAILADLSDEDSPTTQMVKKDMGSEKFEAVMAGKGKNSSVGKDKWARGQVLFYLFGKDKVNLSEAIKNHYSAIARRVNKHDEKQLKSSIYVDVINRRLTERLKNDFGLDLEVPGEYKVVIDDVENKMLWVRKDTKEAIQNLVIRTIPYDNENQVTKANMIALRNEFGKKYIKSDEPEDFMVVNEKDLPVYEYTFELDGRYTREIRGVWEMSKAFAGGPFATYLIVDEKAKQLIYVDAFVLAPGHDKRDLMMQLDFIVKSGKFTNRIQI